VPRGLLQISSVRDDQMGAKIKSHKIPRTSNKTQKIPWIKNNPQKDPMPNFGALKISRKD